MTETSDSGSTADAADRRGYPRWHLSDDATLILDDGDYDVRCALRDVSASGVSLDTAMRPEVGDEAIVYVRTLGRLKAQVARVADDHVALRFLVENERQIVLLQRLERRLVRDRARAGGPDGGSPDGTPA